MTTIGQAQVTCLACGASSEQHYLASTSSFGPPDLDLRPSELARSALWLDVQECPSCGYCAPRIAEGDPYVATAITNEHYGEVRASSEYPELARRFLCSSWLFEVCNQDAPAAWAMLSAAWVCDDEREDLLACMCRNDAARLFRSADEADEELELEQASRHALIADLFRRSRQFDEAELEYAEGLAIAGDDPVRAILELGQKLTELGDADAHSTSELEA